MDHLRSLAASAQHQIQQRPGYQQRLSSNYPPSQFPPAGWTANNQHDPRMMDPITPPATATTLLSRPRRWTPRSLRGFIVIPVIILMIAIAIGLEIGYMISERRKGFDVGKLEDFGGVQFAASFVPVFIAFAFARYWTRFNHEVKRLQPYVVTAHGDAPPISSVLLDYVNLGTLGSFFKAFKLKHRLVVTSIVLWIISNLFQPLASSLFVVRATKFTYSGPSVKITGTFGLRGDFADLNAFSAAAGYAEAAVVHGLGDPPFVQSGWSIATIDLDDARAKIQDVNATVIVDTFGILNNPRCYLSESTTATRLPDGGYTVAGSHGGCSVSLIAEAGIAENFGITAVEGCAFAYEGGEAPPTDDDKFQPITFWFFSFTGPSAAMVFCSPTVEAYTIVANVSLASSVLNAVERGEVWNEPGNNATSGPPLDGRALNGLFFDPTTNKFVNARNVAIQSNLPGAIFRFAQKNGGIDNALNNQTQLLDWTTRIYTQYLAIAAKSNYFLDTQTPIPATVESAQPRLWLDVYATHSFAAAFLIVAIAAFFLHILHTRERHSLRLAGPPGSIAHAVSITSSARFGALLNAADTEELLEQKLRNLRFGIDSGTWQVVVESEREETSSRKSGLFEKTASGRDGDVRKSLLGSQSPQLAPTTPGYTQPVVGTVQRESADVGGIFGVNTSAPPSPSRLQRKK